MSVIRFHGKNSSFKLDTAAVGGVQDVSNSFDDGTFSLDVDNQDTSGFGDQAPRYGALGLEDNKVQLSGWFRDHLGNRVHGKNSRLFMDQYALYNWLDTGKIGRKVEYPDTPGFGDLAKRYGVAGRLSCDFSASGPTDFTASAIDDIARAAKAIDPSAGGVIPIWTIAPNGVAVGALAELIQAKPNKMSTKFGESKRVDLDLGFIVDDVPDLGCVLHGEVSEGATMNGTSVNESAITSLGAAAHLHASAVTGNPNATAKIQHSTDNATWVDLLTFTAITAVTKQRMTVASGVTINQYVRMIISAHAAAGTFVTPIVAFARRGFTYGTVGAHRHFCGLIGGSIWGTLTSSTPLGATAFEFGPAGTGTGSRKYSGNLRLADYSYDFGESKPTKISLTGQIDGQVTPGNY